MIRALVPIAVLTGIALTAMSPAQAQRADVLDDFADVGLWKAVASDGVAASIHSASGPRGGALRLDFDLAGTAGYAIARRALPLTLPDNYEIRFLVRADAAVNDFQVKWSDESGDNVWWVNRRNYDFPREWREVRIKKRHVEKGVLPPPSSGDASPRR